MAVLDGGLPKWRREGRPIEAGTVRLPPGRFTGAARPDRGPGPRGDARARLANAVEQVVDMRPAGRFAGTEPEPRAGLRGGHIPGSRNLPYHGAGRRPTARCSRPTRSDAGSRRRASIPSRPVVATCGSGTSACTLILALHLLGHEAAALYDGSWTEWGGRDDTPVATGP